MLAPELLELEELEPEELELLDELVLLEPLPDLVPELLEVLLDVVPELLEVLLDIVPELLEVLLDKVPELDPPTGPAPDELELLEVLLVVAPELEPETGVVSATDVTWMAKLGSEAEVVPSLAAMMIFGYSPASAALGVPASWPVSNPKDAHAGLF